MKRYLIVQYRPNGWYFITKGAKSVIHQMKQWNITVQSLSNSQMCTSRTITEHMDCIFIDMDGQVSMHIITALTDGLKKDGFVQLSTKQACERKTRPDKFYYFLQQK